MYCKLSAELICKPSLRNIRRTQHTVLPVLPSNPPAAVVWQGWAGHVPARPALRLATVQPRLSRHQRPGPGPPTDLTYHLQLLHTPHTLSDIETRLFANSSSFQANFDQFKQYCDECNQVSYEFGVSLIVFVRVFPRAQTE